SRAESTAILRISGAGDGNRTHVRSLGSFYTAIVRRPLDCLTRRLYTADRPQVQTRRLGLNSEASSRLNALDLAAVHTHGGSGFPKRAIPASSRNFRTVSSTVRLWAGAHFSRKDCRRPVITGPGTTLLT